MIQENLINISSHARIDMIYFSCHQHIVSETRTIASFNICQAFILLLYLIDFPAQDVELYFAPMVLAVFISILSAVWNYYYIQLLTGNLQQTLQIAKNLGHLKESSEYIFVSEISNQQLQDMVDRGVYDYNIEQNNYLSEEQKVIMERRLKPHVENSYINHRWLMKNTKILSVLVSLLLFAYFVFMLIKHPTSNELKNIIIVYLIIECLIKIQIMAYIVICILIPFVFIGFCLYSWLHKKKTGSQYILSLKPKLYKDLAKGSTDTQCSICQQNFVNQDKIIILQCSQLHTYHQFCIKEWFKVANTCPLCRHEFG